MAIQQISSLSIADPVAALLAQQQAEAIANPTPGEPYVPVQKARKFMFRTKPGTVRLMRLRVPKLPESVANKGKVGDFENFGKAFVEKYEKKYSLEERGYFDSLVQKLGDVYLEFTPIPQTHQCYYETDDEEIADFIRTFIVSGRHPYLFEDINGQMVRSQYTDELFPDTPEGRQQRYYADLAYERGMKAAQERMTAEDAETVIAQADAFDAQTARIVEQDAKIAELEAKLAATMNQFAPASPQKGTTTQTDAPASPAKRPAPKRTPPARTRKA